MTTPLQIVPGLVVRHNKRGTEYFIRSIGRARLQCSDSKCDGEPLVEYVALAPPHDVWQRPLSEWTEDRFSIVGLWWGHPGAISLKEVLFR